MKAKTTVVLGIRNVGSASEQPIIESMTTIEAAKLVAEMLLRITMGRRIQIAIARERDEVMVGLGLSKTNREAQLKDRASEIGNYIDTLFGGDDDAPAGESGPDSQHKAAHEAALKAGHAESIAEENR